MTMTNTLTGIANRRSFDLDLNTTVEYGGLVPITIIAGKGRMAWQTEIGYGRRSQVETAIGRYKHLISPKLRARSLTGQ
jgi:hypothetical protein